MKTNLIAKPRYNHNQTVSFTGGIGKIRNYRPDANTWKYIVEMEMGPLPDFGRIGSETTILLY
ncbi:MAG TPA: hypothetical protein V6D28_03095 [Leptolyngbyaceae cyanobacterium]